jgi:hypothetical protein
MVSSQFGPDGLRDCFRDPIPEIFEAAELLDRAVTAHLAGNTSEAERLLLAADVDVIGKWTESIWRRPYQNRIVRADAKFEALSILPEEHRAKPRDAPSAMKRELVARDGFHCRFCAMPLIRAEVRKALKQFYPDAVRWGGSTPDTQHNGFEVMWLQYDHIIPHSKGGETSLHNIVVTCAPCNYGRDNSLLSEVGFRDPRVHRRDPSWRGWRDWDGLERILPESQRFRSRR